MAAGAWTFTNTAREKILRGQFDFDTDVFKTALVLSTSNISTSSTTWAGVTNEVANGLGYLTGGVTVTFTIGTGVSVAVSFVSNPAWTAVGGSIVARWAVLYESGGDVIAFMLLEAVGPADVTATNTNTLTVDNDGTPGPVFTLA